MKTVNEWMELIEDPELRELARSRAREVESLDNREPDEWNAFYGAFDWAKTPEGLRFWSLLFNKYIPNSSEPDSVFVLRLTDKWHTVGMLEVLGVFSSREEAVEGIELYIRNNAWPELSENDRRMLQLHNQTHGYADASFEFDIKELQLDQLNE